MERRGRPTARRPAHAPKGQRRRRARRRARARPRRPARHHHRSFRMTETPKNLTITSRQRTLILVGTLVGMLVAAVSQTIVTTVLPSIAADLNGLSLYTWV